MRHHPRSSNSNRRGTVAPFIVFALTVLLAIFAFAVNKGWLWSVCEELRSAADAAALAAAHELVHDDLIRGDASQYPSLLERAATAGIQFAGQNGVRGRSLSLFDNPDNDNRGDIAFGVVTTPRSADFVTVPGRTTADQDQGRVNTVAVAARQTQRRGNGVGLIFGVFAGHAYADVQAVSGATLDRGVRGFRYLYDRVPLAPIAFKSDLTGGDPLSWESRVGNRSGPDASRFDAASNAFVGSPDGIHEFEAVYATEPQHLANANVVILHFGNVGFMQAIEQLKDKLGSNDFQAMGGQYVLPESGGTATSGQQVGPPMPSPEIIGLASSLMQLRQSGEVRIWPLYESFSMGSSQAQVTGFVAGRVVSVVPPSEHQPLQFTIQATVIARPDAVTDTDLRGPAATMNNNPYVCKVRRIN